MTLEVPAVTNRQNPAFPDPNGEIDRDAARYAADSLKRVLVVDDERMIREPIGRYLTLSGYNVESAATGEDAIALLETGRYAVALCDLRLPGLDGLGFLAEAQLRDPDMAVLILTGVSDAATARKALLSGAADYITKPVELQAVVEAVERALQKRLQEMEQRAFDRQLREDVAAGVRQLESREEALRDMSVGVAEAFVNAIEARDSGLRGHPQRVAELAAEIAKSMGLPDETVDQIHVAGRLHDVGKIGIRQEVLEKNGELTDHEFQHVRDHVRIGLEILAPLKHLESALAFISDHHENWDGTGYPRRLKGEQITLGGRILKAADCYDALTSKRSYRDPMSQEACLDYLRTESGRTLDPRVFDALKEVLNNRES